MSQSLGSGKWAFTKGLHDLGNGVYAWLQPDGGWGWSNAGLVVDQDRSLLVDTLFDVPLTREMLAAMKDAEAAAGKIDVLVNTHSNGDHTNGNELCADAEIIASQATYEEMKHEDPSLLAQLMRGAPDMGEVGQWYLQNFGNFDFEGITHTLPTTTFEKKLERRVGDKAVELLTVGPAHTRGDILIHLPGERTVFTGDILFIDGHPIIWTGPVSNWIAACRLIEEMDVDVVVPGHGPITDKRGAAAMREYLEYIHAETRRRFDAGMDAFEACQDIALDDYSSWGNAERIVINVSRIYKELNGDPSELDRGVLFQQMARISK